MSELSVKVKRIKVVEDVPNSDRLSLCTIDGYQCITNKDEDGNHRFEVGQLVVYVPQDCVLTESRLKEFGYWDDEKGRGYLSGSRGDKVKAVKLRGCLSQGLILSGMEYCKDEDTLIYEDQITSYVWREDQSVADLLDITKYEPPIPAYLSGDQCYIGSYPIHFDLENIKSFPDVFMQGEEVVITEKVHGTLCGVGIIPALKGQADKPIFGSDNNIYVRSKGLGNKGIVFKNSDSNKEGNLYVRTLDALGVFEKLEQFASQNYPDQQIEILGEIFGRGVQDLSYGFSNPTFNVFEVVVGDRNDHKYLSDKEKDRVITQLGVTRVPVLYRGPFNLEVVEQTTNGVTSFNGANIREGAVITAIDDQPRPFSNPKTLRRPILKSVSEAYLLRKGNVTEYN